MREDEHDTNFNSEHFKEKEGHGLRGFFAKLYKVFRKYLGIFNEKIFALKNMGKIWKSGCFCHLYHIPLYWWFSPSPIHFFIKAGFPKCWQETLWSLKPTYHKQYQSSLHYEDKCIPRVDKSWTIVPVII